MFNKITKLSLAKIIIFSQNPSCHVFRNPTILLSYSQTTAATLEAYSDRGNRVPDAVRDLLDLSSLWTDAGLVVDEYSRDVNRGLRTVGKGARSLTKAPVKMVLKALPGEKRKGRGKRVALGTESDTGTETDLVRLIVRALFFWFSFFKLQLDFFLPIGVYLSNRSTRMAAMQREKMTFLPPSLLTTITKHNRYRMWRIRRARATRPRPPTRAAASPATTTAPPRQRTASGSTCAICG